MGEPLVVNRSNERPALQSDLAAPITSIVVPVFKCPDSLPELYARIVAVFQRLGKAFELLLVNDGCPRDSWSAIQSLATRDPRVVGERIQEHLSDGNLAAAAWAGYRRLPNRGLYRIVERLKTGALRGPVSSVQP